ncbi:unnamed protein product [Camellia sinensis]
MIMFGISVSATCVLCEEQNKDHNHLFFGCFFSQRIWQSLQVKCNMQWPHLLLSNLIDWFSTHTRGKSLSTTIYKLVLTCSIYCIWHERNCTIFQSKKSNENSVLSRIKNLIRHRLLSASKFKADQANDWHIKEWSLSPSIVQSNG